MACGLGRFSINGPQHGGLALHLATELVERPKHDDVVALREILDRTDGPTIGWEFVAEGVEQCATARGTRSVVPKLARNPT